jgi:aspartyl/asparaginyl beta-hydroxylase (cupin superfamily)
MKPDAATAEDLLIHIRESKYSGALPCFYQAGDFPELQALQENWQLIWEEVKAYENNKGHITGMNVYTPPDLSSPSAWNNIYFDNYSWRFHQNRKHFPKTSALLDALPGCTHSGISVLSPNSSIAAHYGDTNAVIRCHLGLYIPAPFPDCGIRVGKEEKGWTAGELVIFTEAHYHTAWNHSPERRYLLIFDFIHPKWEKQKYNICAQVLGAQTYVYFEEKFPVLKKIPARFLSFIHRPLSMLWRMYLPLQRSFKFL